MIASKRSLSWVLTYRTRDRCSRTTRHIRLQLRLISKDSIKIFIYHITRADFYLNASRNFLKQKKKSKNRRIFYEIKFGHFWPQIWQCVRSMWKRRFDLSRTRRKNVYRWRSRWIFSALYRLPQRCHINNQLSISKSEIFGQFRIDGSLIKFWAIKIQNFDRPPRFEIFRPVIFFEFPILILFSLRIQNPKYQNWF